MVVELFLCEICIKNRACKKCLDNLEAKCSYIKEYLLKK